MTSDDLWWPLMTEFASQVRGHSTSLFLLRSPVLSQPPGSRGGASCGAWTALSWILDFTPLTAPVIGSTSFTFCDLCFTLLSQNWLMLSGHTWYKREVFITKDHWKVIGEKRSLKPWILFLRDLRDDFQIKKRHIQWHCHYCLRPPPSLGLKWHVWLVTRLFSVHPHPPSWNSDIFGFLSSILSSHFEVLRKF